MTTTTRTANASRRAEREAARLAERRRVERRRRRRLVLAVVGSVLLVAGLVGVVVGTMQHSSGATRGALVPAQVTASGGIVVGSPTAPVKVIAYEDPQCPVCARFERGNGRVLAAAVRDGWVSVEYRMRSFLGPESVRAVNALAAAQDEGQFEPLRALLYANQPPEGTGGYTTDTLIALGRQLGLTSREYVDAVRGLSYAAWVRGVDDRASRDGNVATPELIVNGRTLRSGELFDSEAFAAAIR